MNDSLIFANEQRAGWPLVRLGDCVKARSGNSQLIKGRLSQTHKIGLYPAYSASGQDVFAENYEYDGDGIVLSAVGARCGKSFRATGRWTAIANTHVLRVHPDIADTDFIWFRTNDERFWYRGGSAQPFVKVRDSLARKIHLPPLDEQRKIAAVLGKVQAAVAVEGDLVRVVCELKQAALRQLFTCGLRGEPPRESRFGTVPAAWSEAVLSECAFVQTGIAKNSKNHRHDDILVPYLRVANVQDGRLDLREMKMIQVPAKEAEACLLQVGDVVLTEGGDFDKLGRGFIWEGQIERCVHQNHVFAVRTNRDLLDPRFFAYLAQSPYGKAYFLSVAHKTTNLACINTTKLRAFPVLLPPPEEQREIASLLATLDAKIAHHEMRQGLLRELFSTLLNDLITARRRVTGLNLTAMAS